MLTILLLLSWACLLECLPPPHPVVLQVRDEEASLPDLLRSPALHNPHLRDILPISSLPHHGEQLVYNRPTDVVARASIVSMLTHAGFISRQPNFNNIHHQPSRQYIHNNFIDPPSFASQDSLQYV